VAEEAERPLASAEGLGAPSSGRLRRRSHRLVSTRRRRRWPLRRGGLPLHWRGWPDLRGGCTGVQVWAQWHEEGAGDGGIAPDVGAGARVWRMRRRPNGSSGGGGVNRVGMGWWGAGGRIHRRNCAGGCTGVERAVERVKCPGGFLFAREWSDQARCSAGGMSSWFSLRARVKRSSAL
jgi:hypothetical protein